MTPKLKFNYLVKKKQHLYRITEKDRKQIATTNTKKIIKYIHLKLSQLPINLIFVNL